MGQQFESFCDGSSHQFTANRFYEALYPLRGVQILWRVFGAIRFPHRTEMFNKALIFVFKKISYEKELFSISNCYKKYSWPFFSYFINSRKDHERAYHLSKEWVWTLEGKPVLGPTGDTQSTLYKMQHSSILPLWKTQIWDLKLMFHTLDWCLFRDWCQIGGGWLVPLWCGSGSTQSTEFKQALFLSIWRGDTGSYKRNPKCADNLSFSVILNWLSQL